MCELLFICNSMKKYNYDILISWLLEHFDYCDCYRELEIEKVIMIYNIAKKSMNFDIGCCVTNTWNCYMCRSEKNTKNILNIKFSYFITITRFSVIHFSVLWCEIWHVVNGFLITICYYCYYFSILWCKAICKYESVAYQWFLCCI